MSKSIPAIQSAFLNVEYAKKQCAWAELYWEDEDPDWPECVESIEWAIAALESAKAKIENHVRESECVDEVVGRGRDWVSVQQAAVLAAAVAVLVVLFLLCVGTLPRL